MNKTKGFTLIEVLIASVILFTALSLSALAVKSLRQNSQQADKVIQSLIPLRPIVLSIQQELRKDAPESASGQGQYLDVNYEWVAETLSFRSPLEQMNPDTGQIERSPDRYRLYQVTLQLEFQGRQSSYTYKELAWAALNRP